MFGRAGSRVRSSHQVLGTVLLLLFVFAGLGESQTPTRSFEDLQGQISVGDRIRIIDSEGRTMRGRVAELSATSLGFDDSSRRRVELNVGQVQNVYRVTEDSLKNGALIGFGIATAIVIPMLIYIDDDVTPAWKAFGAGIYIGSGTGIGMLIDKARMDSRLVYAQNESTRLRVAPILRPDEQRLRVYFRF